jgi:uncharacterized protein YbaP (TraB family)
LTVFRQSVLSYLLLLSALFLAACSKPPPPVEIDGPGKPALWKVSGDKGTVWLFGTVHMLPPDADWQSAKLDAAMRDADRLVLEASGLDDTRAVANIFVQMGVSSGQPKLAGRVDPALHPVLDELDKAIPGPRKTLDQLESWAAALTLASATSADLGLSKDAGVEQVLTLRFRADQKPISGLETISEQFGYFDRLPEGDQRAMLNAVLRGARTNRETFQKLLDAWMDGRADAVLEDENGSILASPAVREAILDSRNRKWAVKIDAMLGEGDTAFVAVGAGHLAGKAGLPELLKAAGYKVQRVQ